MIKINSLNKFFNKGRSNEIHVINNISLELPEKGMVAIFGKSGCGKTTLLNVIGGLDNFHSGSVSIKGEKVSENTDVLRNKYIGYIFQNYNLQKEETCAKNVANALLLCGMTDKKEIDKRVEAALSSVDMEKYAKRTPDTLSGGQQQRIAIARAIVKNPQIILADEPTGNLDEANTVMIMDLLKEISKEHLVLLVTHEANLVDYYCDKVIELSDGKVISVRENQGANGFAGKDKNAIYLGEFDKKEIQSDNLSLEYYGEKTENPVKIKMINKEGKLYLKIETGDIQLLDNSSEIKIREGVFEEHKETEIKKEINILPLPNVNGEKTGRIFNLKNSIKSGYAEISKKQKKGNKTLKICMVLFGAVIVFMSAVLGTVIGDIIDVNKSYNHNTFYVKTNDNEKSQILMSALSDGNTGIDYISLYDKGGKPQGDVNISFDVGNFESFENSYYDNKLDTNVVLLNHKLALNLPLVSGKKSDLSDNEIIISTKAADMLLEKSSYGYIKEYEDLLGLISANLTINRTKMTIAGVVESKENVIYISDFTNASEYYSNYNMHVISEKNINYDVNEGETILIIRDDSINNLPKPGEVIKINGKELKVSEIYRYCDYDTFIKERGIQKKKAEEYFSSLMAELYPDISEDDENYKSRYDEIYNENYGKFFEYYYSEHEAYMEYMYLFSSDSYLLWAYFERDFDFAQAEFINETFYKVMKYKKQNGKLPTSEEIRYINLDSEYGKLAMYEYEFDVRNEYKKYESLSYVLDEKDYIAITKINGESHSSVLNGEGYFKENVYITQGNVYTVVHSSSVEETEKYLKANFEDADIITPEEIFREKISMNVEKIIENFIYIGVILLLMSLSMYFIMRSSLMLKVKEIGIYRAIGTSKKNVVFRFFVESLVVATFTVVVGYILSSAFIWACLGISSMLESVFFYPIWYALMVFGGLLALVAICGIIPSLLLLRKTPSQILAKYDI